MLDKKLVISSLASLVAYSSHKNLEAYLKGKESPVKLPGRFETAVILGVGTYAGLKAYEDIARKVGNPFEDKRLTTLKNPGMLVNLVNTGLHAYNTLKASDNAHKVQELSDILNKWATGQAVEVPKDPTVKTELTEK